MSIFTLACLLQSLAQPPCALTFQSTQTSVVTFTLHCIAYFTWLVRHELVAVHVSMHRHFFSRFALFATRSQNWTSQSKPNRLHWFRVNHSSFTHFVSFVVLVLHFCSLNCIYPNFSRIKFTQKPLFWYIFNKKLRDKMLFYEKFLVRRIKCICANVTSIIFVKCDENGFQLEGVFKLN